MVRAGDDRFQLPQAGGDQVRYELKVRATEGEMQRISVYEDGDCWISDIYHQNQVGFLQQLVADANRGAELGEALDKVREKTLNDAMKSYSDSCFPAVVYDVVKEPLPREETDAVHEVRCKMVDAVKEFPTFTVESIPLPINAVGFWHGVTSPPKPVEPAPEQPKYAISFDGPHPSPEECPLAECETCGRTKPIETWRDRAPLL